MKGLSFADAFKLVGRGCQARRIDWNRPAFISYQEVDFYGTVVTVVTMTMKDGNKNAYTPSQCDMLANDWVVIE